MGSEKFYPFGVASLVAEIFADTNYSYCIESREGERGMSGGVGRIRKKNWRGVDRSLSVGPPTTST